jgi:hypothetical protein
MDMEFDTHEPCVDCETPTPLGWMETPDDAPAYRVPMCADCQQAREDADEEYRDNGRDQESY